MIATSPATAPEAAPTPARTGAPVAKETVSIRLDSDVLAVSADERHVAICHNQAFDLEARAELPSPRGAGRALDARRQRLRLLHEQFLQEFEFLLLGGTSALGAGALAWILARIYSARVLELEVHPSPWAALGLILAAAGLTGAVGLLGSYRALQAKPLEVLREE